MRPSVKRALPAKFVDLLRDGEQGQYGGDRSRAVQAIAMAMYRNGWTEEEFRTELLNRDENKLSEWFFQRKRGRARSTQWRIAELSRCWEKAVKDYNPAFQGKSDVLQKVGELKALLLDYPLQGRTKVTDSIILGYLHDMATQRGVINPNASLRDIAKFCNVAHKTASRSLDRLVEAGWLRKEDSQGFGLANTYQLTSPRVSFKKSVKDTLDLPAERVDSVSFTDWRDVDSDHGVVLTRTAISIYKATTDFPQTATEIHQISGISRSTVFKHLKNLVNLGLVKKELTTYTRTEKTIESIAEDCGVVGKRNERHQSIELGRELFHKSEIYQGMAFNYDRENFGMKTAKENALMREHQKIRDLGVDPLTGEILENYVEAPSVDASVTPLKGSVSASGSIKASVVLDVPTKPVESHTAPLDPVKAHQEWLRKFHKIEAEKRDAELKAQNANRLMNKYGHLKPGS